MPEEKWGRYAVQYSIKSMPSPIDWFQLLVSGGADAFHAKAADDLGKSLNK